MDDIELKLKQSNQENDKLGELAKVVPELDYFGIPGHCIDIDGNLWHEPGKCVGAPVNCSGRCCGYVERKP